MIFESHESKDTFEFGKKMAQEANAGDVICLLGDLGVGKTVFTQGFATGLGITEPVSSPTFTIVQEYEEGRNTVMGDDELEAILHNVDSKFFKHILALSEKLL